MNESNGEAMDEMTLILVNTDQWSMAVLNEMLDLWGSLRESSGDSSVKYVSDFIMIFHGG